MLNTHVPSEVQQFSQNAVFQQNGTLPRITSAVGSLFDETFPKSWFGRHGPKDWSERSQDLTPLDLFLWGLRKDKLYCTSVSNVKKSKLKMTTAISNVIQKIPNNVV